MVPILGILSTVPSAKAHTITVDGDPSDWTGVPPLALNYTRSNFEWIWTDPQGDERTDFASPDNRVDLTEFRITADENYVYFMAEMRDIDLATGNGAPMVQVSVDNDRISGSGESWLGGLADTQVDINAEWERLIKTRFGSGSGVVAVYDTGWVDIATAQDIESISTINDVIEFRVGWNTLGVSPPAPLRFTVSTYRATLGDDTWDIGGVSDALDVITTVAGNTWNEVSDGVINYYFDIYLPLENAYFEKECMPDLGQHSDNWCWVAAAANSFWWYAQHGYPELIDDPAVPGLDNLYVTTIIPEPGCPSPEGGYRRLLLEIAKDCGRGFCEPVSDNEYFYGLKKFIADQGAKLYVHEIIDPTYMLEYPLTPPNPPTWEPGVEWRSPTFKDYQRELLRCQDVLLVLDLPGPLNHVVTGVAFFDDPTVTGEEWILISDPWTTGAPDHNNIKENKRYDNCRVWSTGPPYFEIQYNGTSAVVRKMIYVSPKDWFEKECMPDLGQHAANWCWVGSVANCLWWYAQNGYLELLDDPAVPPDNDNAYITQMIPAPDGCLIYRLFSEIVADCGGGWNTPVTDNALFYGLKKFIKDQGLENRLKVEEIITPGWIPPGKYPIEYPNPPENEPGIVMGMPTFDNYKEHLLKCHDVLLVVDWDCDPINHMVTGVGFYDNENVPGDEWILVSDPWTTGAPDHNNVKENKWYDNCQVILPEPPYMLPFRIRIHGMGANVVKMVIISPIVASWTGSVTFKLENLYKLNLYKDNLWLYQGSKLVVKFYKYDNTYENENVIHVFTPPWQVVPENENVAHPGIAGVKTGVRKAKLWLVDNADNEISKIKGWETIRDDLWKRLLGIRGRWPYAGSDERDALWAELIAIRGQWPGAPSTRDLIWEDP